jgi:23S rRNA pseudouridine2605 synthase
LGALRAERRLAIACRLAKAVREATGLSVQLVEQLWEQGRIELDRPARFGLDEIVDGDDTIRVDGKPLESVGERRHFAMHKPVGVITTLCDPQGLPDMRPWQNVLPRGVFPVGRLDRDTSGLLLWTSDGDLSYALLSPAHMVEKEYVVRVRWRIRPSDPRIVTLRQPMRLGVGPQDEVQSVRADLLQDSPGDASDRIVMVVTEGKHRQVRRMCRAAGLPVSALARVRVGPVELGNLAAGQVRELRSHEVDSLWRAVGGRGLVRERQLSALRSLADRRRRAGTPDLRLEIWLDRAGMSCP